MWRKIAGISAGLLIGAGVGVLCCWLLFPASPEGNGWQNYPTLSDTGKASKGEPVVWQHVKTSGPEFRFWMFLGLICGGGFGAVVGAVASMRSLKTEN